MIWKLKAIVADALPDEAARGDVLNAVNDLTKARLDGDARDAVLALQRNLCDLVPAPREEE